jgi:calcineurin-like phosphoesterase family protein
MKYYLTADTHFGHANIIRYCNRPFEDADQMDAFLIKNWNQRVKPDDMVFILGDFCFKSTKVQKEIIGNVNISEYYKSKLNGNKVFVKGNHDNKNSTKTLIKSLQIEFGGLTINCVHNPVDFSPEYDINFVGHIHQNWLIKKHKNSILFNVGVDVHNYMPITVEEALTKISRIKKNEYIEEYNI